MADESVSYDGRAVQFSAVVLSQRLCIYADDARNVGMRDPNTGEAAYLTPLKG